MNNKFSHLPKTNIKAWKNRKGIGFPEHVKVPSLYNSGATTLIISQEQGANYIKEKKARFGNEENFKAWQQKDHNAKVDFCNRMTAE